MKRNKLVMMVLCALLCTQYLLLTSCNKKPKGSFTLKGRLMDSCGGKPIIGRDIIVDLRGGAAFGTQKGRDSIGVGKTDAQGNFEIVCQYWRNGLIQVYTPNGFATSFFIDDYEVKDMEGQTIDFGNIYAFAEFYGCANITVKGSLRAADTLYIAGRPYYPISVGTFKECIASNMGIINYSAYSYTFPRDYYWGFGKAAYDNAVANKLASHKFTVIESLCRDGSVVEVTMEK